jgi:ABC-type oligopeptide transport system substrate-binding subunit
MKNVKIKVKTDEQNLAVQKRLMELNHKNDRVSWYVDLSDGDDYYRNLFTDNDLSRAVCSMLKGYRYLVIDKDLDLVIFINKEEWDRKKEKEVSFEEFIGD